MYFKHFYDPDLAQGGYLIGCQECGEAIVVDPRRDVQVYLDDAAANKLRIVAVTETHIHADYLSGSRELAAATGAALYLSDEGGPDWLYAFDHLALTHGSTIDIGRIELEALHTPGHTPEHLSFLVTDRVVSSEAGYLLTGDFVFVGDVGRPDLLDEAAGGVDTRFAGADALFDSLRDVFLPLPDYVQVWPGHGAGSACGKSLGAVASTTVGYERLTAWWRGYLERGDKAGFVAELLSGQPDAPTYFGRMKRLNREGPALLGGRAPLRRFTGAELASRVNRDLILIDSRSGASQRAGSAPGALSLPSGNSFTTYASYFLDPEVDTREIVVLANDEGHAAWLRDKLAYVGIDRVVGYATSLEGLSTRPTELMAPADLDSLGAGLVLDVRTAGEHGMGAVPGSKQLHAGRLLTRLDELPRGGKIVVYCQGGGRALAAASALRARGFGNVVELDGSYDGWVAARSREQERDAVR